MGLKERVREYVMGPRPLEANSLDEFIALGKNNQLFYVDAFVSVLRERHIGKSKKDTLIKAQIGYKGHTNTQVDINYVQVQDGLGTEENLANSDQRRRIRLAALLTGYKALRQIQEQIPTVAVMLFNNRRSLNADGIQKLLSETEHLGIKPFPIR